MVFKSLRVGFPTAQVTVWINGGGTVSLPTISDAASSANANVIVDKETEHHQWIVNLLNSESDPFWIMDSDLCLWENFEQFDFSGITMAGRFVPQFHCSFAKAITRPRLHGCLMYLDPQKIKHAVEVYGMQFPDCYALPRPTLQDLVFPRYIPMRLGLVVRNVFHDTLCLLYQAIGGKPFTDEQNLAFDHMQSGTLSDIVAPHYPGGDIREHHFSVMENPSLLKGQWERDKVFYAVHAC